MRLRNNYTWIKHYDFILIDLVTLMLSFVISYYLKFNSLNLFQRSDWKSLFIIVCFINLLISFYLNTYSGTLRRRYYEQIIREIPLLFYQVIAVCILFYNKIARYRLYLYLRLRAASDFFLRLTLGFS